MDWCEGFATSFATSFATVRSSYNTVLQHIPTQTDPRKVATWLLDWDCYLGSVFCEKVLFEDFVLSFPQDLQGKGDRLPWAESVSQRSQRY